MTKKKKTNKKTNKKKKLLEEILLGLLILILLGLMIYILIEANETILVTPAPKKVKKFATPLLTQAAYNGSLPDGFSEENFKSGGYYLLNSNDLNKNVELSDVNPKYYTYINVCFFAIDPVTCRLVYIQEGSPICQWYIDNIVKKNKITAPGIPKSSINEIITQNVFKYLQNQVTVEWPKKFPKTKIWPKILLSVGGWDIANHWKLGQMFNILANDAAGKIAKDSPWVGSFDNKFLPSIQEHLKNYSFIDGIDVDWEYPGRPPMAFICQDCTGKSRAKGETYPCPFGGPDAGFGTCDSPGATHDKGGVIGSALHESEHVVAPDTNSVYNGWSSKIYDFDRSPVDLTGEGTYCNNDPACKVVGGGKPPCAGKPTDLTDIDNVGFTVPLQVYGPANLYNKHVKTLANSGKPVSKENYKSSSTSGNFPSFPLVPPEGNIQWSANTLVSCGSGQCDTNYLSSEAPPSCRLDNQCPFMTGTFNYPMIHGGAAGSQSDSSNFVNFIKGLRGILPKPYLLTYTISCAPWGLHWYADAITELDGKPNHTADFINLMSYDYGGWWNSGFVSQWLANVYTDTNAFESVCSPGGQYYVQMPETCDPRANLFESDVAKRTPAGCPFTYLNTLTMNNPWAKSTGDRGNVSLANSCLNLSPKHSANPIQIKFSGCNNNALRLYSAMNTIKISSKPLKSPSWYTDKGLVSPEPKLKGPPNYIQCTRCGTTKLPDGTGPCCCSSPRVGTKYPGKNCSGTGTWGNTDRQMRLTLSINTMITILTEIMKIPSQKLNLGLAYYGRNFQQDINATRNQKRKWQPNSKGIFQFFDRGTNLDFNELYSHYGPKQFQYYNMKGDQGAYPEATEPFISNEKFTNSFRNLCGPQTQPINEFITFYDAFAIEARTKWAKNMSLGGVFCWHILGDYMPELGSPTSAPSPAAKSLNTVEIITICLGALLIIIILSLIIYHLLHKKKLHRIKHHKSQKPKIIKN